MPKFDLTISISVILALCAIVSPIITCIIINIHQTKIRKLELKHAGRCIYYADADALKDYGEHYYSALMYAPEDLKSDMIEANRLMLNDQWNDASVIIEKLSTKIHTILQTK